MIQKSHFAAFSPIALCAALLWTSAWGAPLDPAAVLNSSAQFVRGAHTIAVDFDLVQHYETGDSLVQRGDLLLKEGENFRMRLPGTEFYSDGNTLWEYRPTIKQALARPLAEMGSGFHPSKMLFQYLECKPLRAAEEGSGKNKRIRLTLDPKGKLASLRELEVWLRASDKAPLELRAIDASGNRSRYSFSKMAINGSVNGTEFSFTPPEGVELLDLR